MVGAGRRAVFLDRDGVLNHSLVEGGRPYAPRRAADFRLIEDAPAACRSLAEAGFVLVVVTNQPDIGNGLVEPAEVEEMHRRLAAELPVQAVLCCPHRQTEGCDCRKPRPGLLLQAADRLGIDLDASFMVGDRAGDMAAGEAAGCRTIFIDHDYLEARPSRADCTARSLAEATPWILAAAGLERGDIR